MDIGTIISIICGAGALLISANSSFQTRRSAQERLKTLEEYSQYKIDNEKRFTRLETNWNLFTRVIEKDLGQMLHSPHRRDLDEFIDKNNRDELTREEAIKFVQTLDETLQDHKLRPGEEVGIKLYKASIIARYRLMELVI